MQFVLNKCIEVFLTVYNSRYRLLGAVSVLKIVRQICRHWPMHLSSVPYVLIRVLKCFTYSFQYNTINNEYLLPFSFSSPHRDQIGIPKQPRKKCDSECQNSIHNVGKKRERCAKLCNLNFNVYFFAKLIHV